MIDAARHGDGVVETSVKHIRPLTSLTAAALSCVILSTSAQAQVVKPIGFGAPTQTAVPLRMLNEAPSVTAQIETQKMAIVEDGTEMPLNQPVVRGTPPLGFPFTYPAKKSLADLVEQVSPAVVNIIVKTETAESVTEGQGSGFVIDPKGELVTNYHVIEGGTTIEVEFNNGERFGAEVVGIDPETDLAVLKIQSERMFTTVQFHRGDELRIGDWVVAIGNPFGIGQSTSFGIISAIGRERVESGAYVDYIQTDATINTGNSGGPLFNPEGDVVGVNSAIYSPTGASVGIAFSIPHQTAEAVVNQLRREGRVRRGWLGAGLRTAEFSSSGGLIKGGATINNVVAGSPADIYGLQIDDVILNINDEAVRNSTEATRLIGNLRPNQKMSVIYERNETPYKVMVMIGERPEKDIVDQSAEQATEIAIEAPSLQAGSVRHGMSIVDLSAESRSALGMRYDQLGVYVESVSPNGQGALAGIQANAVLMQIDGRDIPSALAFENMVFKAQEQGKTELIILLREPDGRENMVVLAIPLG